MTEGTQARPERVMVLEPDAERRQMLAQTLMIKEIHSLILKNSFL